MTFTAATYQNEHLASGATEVHAIVTVEAAPSNGAQQPVAAVTEKAIVLIIDTSGSMSQSGSKIRAARQAAATAISRLPDGTLFAVIQGGDFAELAYPPDGGAGPALAGPTPTRGRRPPRS